MTTGLSCLILSSCPAKNTGSSLGSRCSSSEPLQPPLHTFATQFPLVDDSSRSPPSPLCHPQIKVQLTAGLFQEAVHTLIPSKAAGWLSSPAHLRVLCPFHPVRPAAMMLKQWSRRPQHQQEFVKMHIPASTLDLLPQNQQPDFRSSPGETSACLYFRSTDLETPALQALSCQTCKTHDANCYL